ncbi:MAG: NFACT RNA binding domain-containing protein, partial [Firmicutes bacterium]|nr:NFACT RNA binding domain-containing protein [Bacillota bacterium]
PGRTIWPGQPYTPPPALPDACESRRIEDLPPRARELAEQTGSWDWPQFCRQFAQGNFSLYTLSPAGQSLIKDIWVFPVPGYDARLIDDPDHALDIWYAQKEREKWRHQAQRQLQSHFQDRLQHLTRKLHQYQAELQEDAEAYQDLGNLWLAYQSQFHNSKQIVVPSFKDPDHLITLTLADKETPVERAQAAFKRYKKLKARTLSLTHLLPSLQEEIAAIHVLMDQIRREQDDAWYRQQLQKLPQKAPTVAHAEENLPYREFRSLHGYAIFVGKNKESNQDLTFHKAKPDDIWLHVKQSPGSHVILATGKTDPPLEDLLDAAHLAAFYSTAQHSSMIPVDYTRRKWVRKRAHAEAGQVLYQREKSLFITPDTDRLKRLGAVSEKLT